MNIDKIRKMSASDLVKYVLAFFTVAFYIGAVCAPDRSEIFSGLSRILTSPSQLTKDYFFLELGSVSGACLNVALVGTACCALMFIPTAVAGGATVAGYMLTVGFAFFGMNILNILPFFLGVFVYSLIKKQPFAKNINLAMFSTALAPLVSEVLYRYPNPEVAGVGIVNILLALVIGLVVGLAMPALCAHAGSFHKGYNLYNAGPAAGFLCVMIYAIMYKTLGIAAPEIGATLGAGAGAFVNIFCIVVFALCVIAGFILNGNSFKGYDKLILDSGFKADFTSKYGMGLTAINIGVYGLFILAYYNLIGATFTGPTFGAIWCMLAFGAAGSTPLNVLPIMIGYYLASLFGVSAINAQGMVVGLCFASGLAPISGRYGLIAGVVAGLLHYCLVTSVPAMHGGFNLYNGGFTSGIVCFVMVPVLECYFKTREERKLKTH